MTRKPATGQASVKQQTWKFDRHYVGILHKQLATFLFAMQRGKWLFRVDATLG